MGKGRRAQRSCGHRSSAHRGNTKGEPCSVSWNMLPRAAHCWPARRQPVRAWCGAPRGGPWPTGGGCRRGKARRSEERGARSSGRRGGASPAGVDRAAEGSPPAPRDAGAGAAHRRCGGPRTASGRADRRHRGGRPRRRRSPAWRTPGPDRGVPGGHGRGAAQGHRGRRPGGGPCLRARHPHHGRPRRRAGPGATAAATERNGGVPLPARRGDPVRGPRTDRRGRAGAHRRCGDPCAALRTVPRRHVRGDTGLRAAGPGQGRGDSLRA